MKKAKLKNNHLNNKKEETSQSNSLSVKNVVIVVVSIIMVFVAFYFLTDYLIANRKSVTEPNGNEVNKGNYISFTDIYKQKDKTYYVLAITENDKNKEKYSIYAKDMSPLYYIDMTDAFNKSHMGDKDVVTATVKDIVISDTTLFIIKENKLESYHTGYENIKKYIISNLEKPSK